MDASDIRGLDELGNLIEAARCLGLVQSRKAFGQYGPDDAASEHGLHASISERSARLRAENERLRADADLYRHNWQEARRMLSERIATDMGAAIDAAMAQGKV